MKDKSKRTLVVVAVILLLITSLAVIIFSIHRFKNLLDSKKSAEENLHNEEIREEDGEIIIKLTKNNWDKYFTIKTEPELIWNKEGVLEKVQ